MSKPERAERTRRAWVVGLYSYLAIFAGVELSGARLGADGLWIGLGMGAVMILGLFAAGRREMSKEMEETDRNNKALEQPTHAAENEQDGKTARRRAVRPPYTPILRGGVLWGVAGVLQAPLPLVAVRLVGDVVPTSVVWAGTVAVWISPVLVLLAWLGLGKRATSDADSDREIALVSLWVALPYYALLTTWRGVHPLEPWAVAWMLPLFVVCVLAPALLAVFAATRFALRRRWLAKVRAGAVSQWRVRRAELAASGSLPRMDDVQNEARVDVLVRVCGEGDPYRDAGEEPVATLGRRSLERDGSRE
jgi:hypothetical protein